MTDSLARTIAALREFPVAVAAELYRLAPGRKPPNGDDILVLCDAAEASLRATNEIERAYQILEVNGVPRGRARNIANGIDVLVTRMERGLRCPPREPTREMIDAALSVGTGIYIAEKTWRAMWDAAQINEGGPAAQPVAGNMGTADTPGSAPPSPPAPAPDKTFSTAVELTQQERHDDNDSTSFDRGQQGVRSERGGSAAGAAADDGSAGALRRENDPRRASADGQGNGRFPILIDNETLRQQIAADPDDEPSAGNVAPAPDAQDDRYCWHAWKMGGRSAGCVVNCGKPRAPRPRCARAG